MATGEPRTEQSVSGFFSPSRSQTRAFLSYLAEASSMAPGDADLDDMELALDCFVVQIP